MPQLFINSDALPQRFTINATVTAVGQAELYLENITIANGGTIIRTDNQAVPFACGDSEILKTFQRDLEADLEVSLHAQLDRWNIGEMQCHGFLKGTIIAEPYSNSEQRWFA